MQIRDTQLPGVLLLEPRVFTDARGFFFEAYNRRELAHCGLDLEFVQDNQSRSQHRVLRGLHYQVQKPQGKLVRVLAGEIFDVAVDLRRSSPAFGRWTGARLSADNHLALWIPPGFAHGFLVLSEQADVLYKATDYYAPELERVLRWDDPQIAIEWPLIGVPILSARDQAAPGLHAAEAYA
jgi:dTDP-4-dehydrorhamnose 3,5-epimerase